MSVVWWDSHKASAVLDASANYDAGDPIGRDLQLQGAISHARLASYTSEDEWAVTQVVDGKATVISRYRGGQRSERNGS